MALVFYNNSLLVKSGSLATGVDCCCAANRSCSDTMDLSALKDVQLTIVDDDLTVSGDPFNVWYPGTYPELRDAIDWQHYCKMSIDAVNSTVGAAHGTFAASLFEPCGVIRWGLPGNQQTLFLQMDTGFVSYFTLGLGYGMLLYDQFADLTTPGVPFLWANVSHEGGLWDIGGVSLTGGVGSPGGLRIQTTWNYNTKSNMTLGENGKWRFDQIQLSIDDTDGWVTTVVVPVKMLPEDFPNPQAGTFVGPQALWMRVHGLKIRLTPVYDP